MQYYKLSLEEFFFCLIASEGFMKRKKKREKIVNQIIASANSNLQSYEITITSNYELNSISFRLTQLKNNN